MLSFFSDPYKDELLYSAFARYHFESGNIDLKDTLSELFGKNSIIPNIEIGSNLNYLCQQVGKHYNPIDLIQKHTIFPYYIPFLPEQRKKELITTIRTTDATGVFGKIGITAGSICKKDGIWYCPKCSEKELHKLSEAYIHREHQLQGILYCPHDGCALKKYPVDRRKLSRLEYIKLEERLIDLTPDPIRNTRHYNKHLSLSQAAYYLLSTDLTSINKSIILKKYKTLLYQHGLTTLSLRVKQSELHERLVYHYGEEFLISLESLPDKNDEYNWLRVATRNVARTAHPLRHLLLINFLVGNDIQIFFDSITKDTNPFGEGPWPCLNQASDHYRQPVIKKIIITPDYKTRQPVGTFECKCGFTYSRRGPDKSEEDNYRFGRIKQFGLVWEERLKVLLNDKNLTQQAIAEKLGCDPGTIKKYREQLLSQDIMVPQNTTISIENIKQTEYKNTILTTVQSGLSRKEIHDNYSKEYTYLYRHDKEWLFATLPAAKKPVGGKGYIDWEQRDKQIKSKLQIAYNKLLLLDKPVRITKTKLGKEIKQLALLEYHLDKMPLCTAYLGDILESEQDFQIRRCKLLIDAKRKESLPVKIWEIQRKAGLRKEALSKILPIIENYIDTSLRKYSE